MSSDQDSTRQSSNSWAVPILLTIYFISGFTALLYQVVWQRMLGLFCGSDVRSVTIVIASYLLGLGVGSLIGGSFSARFSGRRLIQVYALCNLAIASFALCSRFLFYDLLFLQLKSLAASPVLLPIVFVSLLIPTTLMGISLPLLAKATSRRADKSAMQIGLLYGLNTLGSGLGTLISGWYMIGILGYEGTVYLGAILSGLVGLVALGIANQFKTDLKQADLESTFDQTGLKCFRNGQLMQWCILVFGSGFVAISLEIIWFRVLDTVLQSIAYTYAHLLAFILVSNALGSVFGARVVRSIRQPRLLFLWIQGTVVAYSAVSIWLISLYRQINPPDLQIELGYIDLNQISTTVFFNYLLLPLLMLVPPNLLLGFYFPLVQQAVQTDDQQIGRRVGLIQVANILGNTTGSLLTGLVLLNWFGTVGSLRLLVCLGLMFVLLSYRDLSKVKVSSILTCALSAMILLFPSNSHFWAALHGLGPQQYFLADEDATGVAAITEDHRTQRGTLFASGQVQAGFPYMQVHALLGSVPALMHPNPAQIMVIGLGSGGTAHTAGVNPLTQRIQVVELLGAELEVLRRYAQTPIGQPLNYLFQDRRYSFTVGDGRRELTLANRQFDIIEADAIYPWRSRAGMLYSREFFQEVRTHLAPGGIFVEWQVDSGTEQTFRNVFPHVTQLKMSQDLYVLVGSEHPVEFNRQALLDKLQNPTVISFLANARVNLETIRQDIQAASVQSYTQVEDGMPTMVNTDLFPRSEYYLNR
jgi:spermidine synthase